MNNIMSIAEFSIEETKKKLTHYGMSYSDLAEQIDMQLSSLSQYLNNKLKIPKSAIIRIVMYFNIVTYQKQLEVANEKIEGLLLELEKVHQPSINLLPASEEINESSEVSALIASEQE